MQKIKMTGRRNKTNEKGMMKINLFTMMVGF